MAPTDTNALSQFLNYGGLGLLAILCLVVLGYNAWSLNGLVAKADPKRIQAARPLLLGQMAVSLIGLGILAAGGIYVEHAKGEDNRRRTAQILLDPWDRTLAADLLPAIEVDGRRWTGRRPIEVECTLGRAMDVTIDMDPFIRHRAAESMRAQGALVPIASAPVER